MKTASTKPSHYELLLKAYDKALATYERTKTEEKAAKHYHKSAMKDTSKSDLKILGLEYERIKFRRKSRKAALKIAAIRLKVWAKMHDEEVKIYQLSDTAMVEEIPIEPKKAVKREVKEDKKKTKVAKQVKTKEVVDIKAKKASKIILIKEVKEVKPTVVDAVVAQKAPRKSRLISEVKEETPVIVEPVEVPKPARKPRRSSAEVEAEKAANKEALVGDSFSLIEGIGEKVTLTLHQGGITTFAQLAASDVDTLKGILRAAKNRVANPGTWAEQAKLIIDNKFEELKTLQDTLKGGRKVQ